MFDRIEAESIIQSLTGGNLPGDNNTIVYKRDVGWFFQRLVSDAFNVIAFGAIGDGVVDDTVAIQSAIDSASDLGGGTVLVPSGVYIASQLKMKSKVILRGNGHDSVLKQKANTTGALISLDNVNVERCTLIDFKIDGNKANQTASNDGIDFSPTGGVFETNDPHYIIVRVAVFFCKGDGISWVPNTRESLLFKVHAKGCDGEGFNLASTDNMIVDCTAEDCGLNGFNTGDQGSRFQGCKAFGNSVSGFKIRQPFQTFIGCAAEDNDDDGFWLENSSNNMLSSCYSNRNGVITADGAGFHLETLGGGQCDDNILVGCVAINNSGTTQDYGLKFTAGGPNPLRNTIILIANDNRIADFIGDLLGNQVFINVNCFSGGLMTRQQRISSLWGTLGVGSNEHFRSGKVGSGVAGNPYFVFQTTGDSPPIGSFQGFDGTTTKSFFDCIYDLGDFNLGNVDSVLPRMPSYTTAARPAPGRAGRFIFNSTVGGVQYDDGAAWQDVSISIGDITRVNIIAGIGLSGDVDTLAGDHIQTIDFDASVLTALASGLVGADELVVSDAGISKRALISAINLGIFVNDQGWTNNIGDITRVNIIAGIGLSGSQNTPSGDHVQTLDVSGLTNAEIAAAAEIEVSKLADGDAEQVLITDGGGANVAWASSIEPAGRIGSKYGTAGSSDNEHWRGGKVGSPATNNPYYVFKTNGATVPVAFLQGWDGASALTFLTFDYGGGLLDIGDQGSGVIPRLARFTNAQRPSAGTAGRVIFNTDDGNLNIDDGTNWILPDGTTT